MASISMADRIREWTKAVRQAGPERENAQLVVKSVLAASVSWYLAMHVFGSASPTFAPFSALLMMQPTIAQSLDQTLRYIGAVLAGVVLVGVTGLPWGPSPLIFGLMLLMALGLSRWRRLGNQRLQVAVAAVFAYGTFAMATDTSSAFSHVAAIVWTVLLGCTIGVLTNILIAPPLRYRSVRYAVEVLADSAHDLLHDIGNAIGRYAPDDDESRDWERRAHDLRSRASQTRETIEHVAESVKFNPRRLLNRGDDDSFDGYRAIVDTLERAVEEICSIARGLSYAATRENVGEAHERFLRDYARLLITAGDVVGALGQLHTTDDLRDGHGLDDALARCREAGGELATRAEGQQLDDPDDWAVYGGLHTDGRRLAEELTDVRNDIAELLEWLERKPSRQR